MMLVSLQVLEIKYYQVQVTNINNRIILKKIQEDLDKRMAELNLN